MKSLYLLAASLVGCILFSAALAEPLTLALPAACELGRTCEIQHYFDGDASPAARDYQCGNRTYDGHNGTDIRLPTLAALQAGVRVVAAAAGRVLRVRDGVEDVSIKTIAGKKVAGRECGNGVVVAHEDGWQTQYCHLAKGSVRVKPGDKVE